MPKRADVSVMLKSMKVGELKQLLRSHNIEPVGIKVNLIAKVKEDLLSERNIPLAEQVKSQIEKYYTRGMRRKMERRMSQTHGNSGDLMDVDGVSSGNRVGEEATRARCDNTTHSSYSHAHHLPSTSSSSYNAFKASSASFRSQNATSYDDEDDSQDEERSSSPGSTDSYINDISTFLFQQENFPCTSSAIPDQSDQIDNQSESRARYDHPENTLFNVNAPAFKALITTTCHENTDEHVDEQQLPTTTTHTPKIHLSQPEAQLQAQPIVQPTSSIPFQLPNMPPNIPNQHPTPQELDQIFERDLELAIMQSMLDPNAEEMNFKMQALEKSQSYSFVVYPRYELNASIIRPTVIPTLSQEGYEERFDLDDLNGLEKCIVQLRFGHITELDKTCHLDQEIEQLCIDVNGQPFYRYLEDARHLKSPFDITKLCMMNERNIVKLWIDNEIPWSFPCLYEISLVKCNTVDNFLTLLKSNLTSYLDHEYTIRLANQRLGISSSDVEMQTNVLKILLECPISKQRMSTPCRTVDCLHLECFDASFFFRVNECKTDWLCPLCKSPASLAKLRIDRLFEEMLQNPTSIAIEFIEGGNYRVIEENRVEHDFIEIV